MGGSVGSKQGKSCDNDTLILLAYHWKLNMATVHFDSEMKKMMWKVQYLISNAGELIKS